MQYFSVIKKIDTFRQINGTRRKLSELGNPDPERQTRYVLTDKWILDVKQRIARLKSTSLEKSGKLEDPKKDKHVWPIERKIITISLVIWKGE